MNYGVARRRQIPLGKLSNLRVGFHGAAPRATIRSCESGATYEKGYGGHGEGGYLLLLLPLHYFSTSSVSVTGLVCGK